MDLKSWGEFGLIEHIQAGIQVPEGITGIGDDCAIIPQQTGRETLVSTDMLVEGSHFLMDHITPYQLGWKSAAVNISDLAAMGGRCVGSFLSFALPKGLQQAWIEDFFRGYKELSALYDCPLLGGDTTTSPDRLCINVTVLGEMPSGTSVKRNGAKVGDWICVTGPLGDSAAGLQHILQQKPLDEAGLWLVDRHYLPRPRIREGMALAAAGVHAMMDISDGIGSDLRHILKASGVGAEVDLRSIPVSEVMQKKCADFGWDPLELALSGGEDYELLFTLSPEQAEQLTVPHHRIGRIVAGNALTWVGGAKDYVGFRHF